MSFFRKEWKKGDKNLWEKETKILKRILKVAKIIMARNACKGIKLPSHLHASHAYNDGLLP